MSSVLLDIAQQRFEQEANHAESIDAKAGSLIGYAGVISTFIGFLFTATLITPDAVNKNAIMIGVILSLLSISTGFIILIQSKKQRDVFLVEEFVDDNENNNETVQIKEALNAYLVLIENAEKRNNTKSIILYIGNGLLAAGIVISFISIFYKPLVALIFGG